MGNDTSQEEPPPNQFDGIETLGYRILGVQPNSPASRAGLVSFFDFLVGVNGQLMFGCEEEGGGGGGSSEFFEDVDFPALLKGSINQEIELLVWNIKSEKQRFLNLTPSTSWGGTGLLGVTIRTDDYSTAEEHILRILSVTPRSPAALAGLTPLTDFLLGTAHDSFRDEESLAESLIRSEGRVLEMYVYNSDSDVVRVVSVLPTMSWSDGEDSGLLGAEVGRGYLHRLPKACRGTNGVSFERRVRGAILDVATVGGGGGGGGGGGAPPVDNGSVSTASTTTVPPPPPPSPVVKEEGEGGGDTSADDTIEGAISSLADESTPTPQELTTTVQPSPPPLDQPPPPVVAKTVDADGGGGISDGAKVQEGQQQQPPPAAPSFMYSLPPAPKLLSADGICDDDVRSGNTAGGNLDLPPPPPLNMHDVPME